MFSCNLMVSRLRLTFSFLAKNKQTNSFLGSEKYPGENEYKRFLSAHGGQSNASTSMHLTTYKNTVLANHAEKVLDIFSNFFVAPLFTSSGTGREVQAVDSENSKNLTADPRRRLQILKDLADPEHYYSKFSTGNSTTLPTHDDEKLGWIRDALLAFHRKHYTPENMTFVVAGPQSLDTLQEWVVPRLSAIKSKEFPENKDDTTPIELLISEAAKDLPSYAHEKPKAPFSPAFKPSLQGSWPVMLTTKPLRSMRKLVMMFPMPSDLKVPDQSPSSVMSHLLGHEGAGSAFAVLQNHGMLSSLSAGSRTSAPDFNLFQVDMGLTEKGEKHWKEVVDLVFAYCRLVTESALQAKNGKSDELQRIYGEVSALDAMFFHQSSPGGVYSYAPNLAERVLAYGPEACLSAGSMLNESEATFPLDEVIQTSRLLVPSNCIIERCSEVAWEDVEKVEQERDGFGKRKEQWYGVEYFLSHIDEKVVQAWSGSKGSLDNPMDLSQLSLPRRNRYIPRTLDLSPDLPPEARLGPRIEKVIEPPNLLIDDKNGRLFHRLDDRYALPQSSMTFLIRNAAVQHVCSEDGWKYDSNASLLSSFLSGAFNEAMAQETYDAQLAGLYWGLSCGTSGVKLTCFGFSDRLSDFSLELLGMLLV
jgi:insulysin